MANSQTVMLVIRSARPSFRNNRDKAAFVVHASFVASGFRLVAIGRPAFAEDALASSPTQGEVGIEGWNEFDEYAFVYAKGLKKFLVKCFAIDDKLLVDAVAEGGKEPEHLEIEIEKYVGESGVEGDYDAQFKNLGKLVTDLQDQILYKLDEGLKPVASTSKSSSETNQESETGYYGGPPVIGGFGDGSMHVGPSDTRMFPGFGNHPAFMIPPQPGVPPPGVWYDPRPHYGPEFGPGFEPGPFRRQLPSRPADVHPDLQHFRHGSGSDNM
ncbi:unnamed protein product [Eruca vesicaria subsp. sativa]|uniref:PI31 proteasome regulator N-terminal domain-containing protein n=1 Tax=Eruca vesicaria subsp. sativa TaxID=29727 RepID=A0ABC8LGN6_ERUVS|nr:unnamed protein product [Eruca vesicaria subsp. sativa]